MNNDEKSLAECIQEDDEDETKFHRHTQSVGSLNLKTRSGRCVKFNSDYMEKYAKKKQQQNLMYQVKKAIKKCATDRTKDDIDLLTNCQDLVKVVDLNERNRLIAAAHQEIVLDDPHEVELKCKELADAIRNSKVCVFYTGAGISTSASIPDYRGPNGLWTQLEKGNKIELPDFASVTPTYSHMALSSLMKLDLVKHVVSQNCDGLHIRSGLDREKLSELHGNCFIEFCSECNQEYVRLFDVTERSSFRKHSTGRYCKECSKNDGKESQLRDSIIHFGEKLRNGSPYNWEAARDTVKQADLIVCFGTSCKVLKHYACLWPKKTKNLIVCNIQWTPKDKIAKLKINAYCDQVMKLVLENLKPYYSSLKLNEYSFKTDPIFKLAVKLSDEELKTTNKSFIVNENVTKKFKSFKSESKLDEEEKSILNGNSSILDIKSEEENNTNSWFTRSFKQRKKTLSTTTKK